jgi:hypothetical protein
MYTPSLNVTRGSASDNVFLAVRVSVPVIFYQVPVHGTWYMVHVLQFVLQYNTVFLQNDVLQCLESREYITMACTLYMYSCTWYLV